MGRFLIGLLIVAVIALGGAFYYYSEPDIARDVLEAKYAAPPSQFVMLGDGARAHIRDRGPRDAPVLMLIHGSNASLFTWEPWASRLSDSFRVVSIDLPGHGLTGAVPNQDYSQEGMVWFVKEVADKLGLQSFAIAGNSMGGGVAARFAEEYPQRVNHLILVDAGGMAVAGGDKIPLAFQLARIPVVNRVMLYVTPRSLVTDGLNKAIVHKDIINDAMIDSYWDFARMEGTRQATLDRFSLDADDSVRAHIAAITAPTLILWGAEDGLIPVAAAYAYQKAIPGAKLIVYPATGHIPQEEVADRSAADVRAFLTAN
ncbi:MAG TPA: alpha/beta hydrolase [Rhizomicrobium sp.]|nr:alpha/beta hydrolase [Rhizomicrobium sp.]